MLAIAMSFFLGDTWVQCLPALNFAYLFIPVALAVMAVATLRSKTAIKCGLFFIAGIAWAWWHASMQLQDDLQRELEAKDVLIAGVIVSIPEYESYGVKFEFATVKQSTTVLPARLQVSWYSRDVKVHAGECWQLMLKLKRRHGFANPGGFDYEGQLFREGIGATGYVRESRDNRLIAVASGNLVLRMRATLAEQISAAIPQSSMQGVVRGLAVGDQQAITSEQWQVFSRTGISHLIAISGSHIGMVALLFGWMGGGLIRLPAAQRLRLTRQDMQAALGLPAAVAYSLLAGTSVPTQRTLIMLAIFFIARVWRRETNIWNSFGLALFAVTLLDPFAPLAVGTWLSFGAVGVILLNRQGRLGRDKWWREFLGLQAVVTLGLLPLLIGAFGNVSLISPWVNLIAIPVFTVLLVPAVLTGCVLLLANVDIGTWWLQHLSTMMEFFYQGLKWAASTPVTTWYLAQPPWWTLLLMCFGTLMVVVPLLWPMRVCGAFCCLPALMWQPVKVPAQSFELTALDVGQGLSLVIRTASHVMVYDTGPRFQSRSDTAALVVLPYLRSLGIGHLDMVMISHADDDHAGGMATLQQGMTVEQWTVGPSVATGLLVQSRWSRCQSGQHWEWDDVQFDVLWPALSTDAEERNNSSCVLRISTAGGSALLMGDAEAPVEQQLVVQEQIQLTSIVVAGHHGSRSSSIAEFVNAAHAQEVVFSAGYLNHWGFPKSDVVDRWRSAGAHTNSTVDAGAITIQVTAQGVTIPLWYRNPQRHYWQDIVSRDSK